MKFYFQKVVFGFLFGLGFCLALFIADKLRSELNKKTFDEIHKEQMAESKRNLEERTLDAKKVLVTKNRLVKTARQVSVAIRVENKHELPFGSGRVLIKFFDESGLFGECNGYLENFDAGEVRERVIQCSEYSSMSFPENVRLEAQVRDVQKYGYGR